MYRIQEVGLGTRFPAKVPIFDRYALFVLSITFGQLPLLTVGSTFRCIRKMGEDNAPTR